MTVFGFLLSEHLLGAGALLGSSCGSVHGVLTRELGKEWLKAQNRRGSWGYVTSSRAPGPQTGLKWSPELTQKRTRPTVPNAGCPGLPLKISRCCSLLSTFCDVLGPSAEHFTYWLQNRLPLALDRNSRPLWVQAECFHFTGGWGDLPGSSQCREAVPPPLTGCHCHPVASGTGWGLGSL